MQLGAEKSKYKESSDERPGDPVTMACYERVLEARQDDTSITRKYPRVSGKKTKRNRERAAAPRRLQNFYPITRFSSHIISL